MTQRTLVEVLDKILEIAPDLSPHLEDIRSSAQYASPEMMPHWWKTTAFTLNLYAHSHPKRDELQRIFAGNTAQPEVSADASTTPSATDLKFQQMMSSILGQATASDTEPAPPKMVKVLLHNDPRTPYQLVIDVLVQAFKMERGPARTLMYHVHNRNTPSVVCVLSETEADAAIAQANTLSEGYPLQFTKEDA